MNEPVKPTVGFIELVRAGKRLPYFCEICQANTDHKLIDIFNGAGGWECCKCGARQLPGQPGPKP